MNLATTPYRPLMQSPVPIGEWLTALFELLVERNLLIPRLTLQGSNACAKDAMDVMLATFEGLDGLLYKAETTCNIPCPFPGLLFIVCCRLTPPMACLTGMMYYPNAVSHLDALQIQGPLPSIDECMKRRQESESPSAWGVCAGWTT